MTNYDVTEVMLCCDLYIQCKKVIIATCKINPTGFDFKNTCAFYQIESKNVYLNFGPYNTQFSEANTFQESVSEQSLSLVVTRKSCFMWPKYNQIETVDHFCRGENSIGIKDCNYKL